MASCLIGLGSNVGDRAGSLHSAVEQIRDLLGVRIRSLSSFHETAPVGGPLGQGMFLNAVATIETALSPEELLRGLLEVEKRLGRRQRLHWNERPIDLDLLLYDDRVIETEELCVPHPRMAFRRFVIEPAAEVAADWKHPTIGWTVEQLREHLRHAMPYVAICGPIGVGKTEVAERLHEQIGGRLILETVDQEGLTRFYADTSGEACRTELEFLQRRARLLDRDAWDASQKLVTSDFWFDQSRAFASVWLSTEQMARFEDSWQEARSRVVPPKLIVLLDVPSEEALARIAHRGRPFERALGLADIENLRQALHNQADRPGLGPMLRISQDDSPRILDEIRAAIEAMQ